MDVKILIDIFYCQQLKDSNKSQKIKKKSMKFNEREKGMQ